MKRSAAFACSTRATAPSAECGALAAQQHKSTASPPRRIAAETGDQTPPTTGWYRLLHRRRPPEPRVLRRYSVMSTSVTFPVTFRVTAPVVPSAKVDASPTSPKVVAESTLGFLAK